MCRGFFLDGTGTVVRSGGKAEKKIGGGRTNDFSRPGKPTQERMQISLYILATTNRTRRAACAAERRGLPARPVGGWFFVRGEMP